MTSLRVVKPRHWNLKCTLGTFFASVSINTILKDFQSLSDKQILAHLDDAIRELQAVRQRLHLASRTQGRP